MDGRNVKRHESLTGQVFSRWTVLNEIPKDHALHANNRHAMYFCRCICGKIKPVAAIHLRSGSSKSCDCLRVDILRKRKLESLYNRLVSHSSVKVNLTYEEFLCFASTLQI